jgi:hypothetical protein
MKKMPSFLANSSASSVVTFLSSTRSLLLPANSVPTHKYRSHIAIGILSDIGEPRFDVREGVFLGDVVHQDGPRGVLVVRVRDRPVPAETFLLLLAGRVPKLDLHRVVVDLHGLRREIDPDRRPALLVESVPREPAQKVGFADS